MEWTAAQRQVLDHKGGWLLVRGPRGSGRTTTLVRRWRRFAKTAGPGRILVLSRSRDGAAEFGRAALSGQRWAAESLPFTTVYGVALDVVRRHRGDCRLLTRTEQWAVVRRMLAEDDERHWPSCRELVRRAAFVDEVASAVLCLEGAGVGDDAVLAVAERRGQRQRWLDLLAFRSRYRGATTAMGALDAAQLFTEAAALLSQPQVAAAESGRWDEVLVDDADVLSSAMGRVIELCAPERLVAIGDVDVAGSTGIAGPSVMAHRPSRWLDDVDWPATVYLAERFRIPPPPRVLRCRHPSTEPDAIAGALLAARDAGVSWRDMAVLVRSERRRVQAIGRALGRYGVPVRLTPGSPAAEPAVRAIIDFFAWAAGDESALARLLVSPAVDLPPGDLRRLRLDAISGGPPVDDHPRIRQLTALRDRLAPTLRSADPGDLAYQAWVELLGGLVPDPDAVPTDSPGTRALDAVASFLAGISDRASRDPHWRIADEVAFVEGPDFAADPWVPLPRCADADLVTVTTIGAAAARVWDTVVIAGCLEGELPRLSVASRFFDDWVPDRAAATALAPSRPLPTLGERRRELIERERRLFDSAVSCARRRLVATAAPAAGQLVSRFVADASPEAACLPRPRVAVGALGQSAASPTETTVPIHLDGRLSLSATRLKTYDDCPLRYFYQYALGVRGPGGVAASIGTIVHAVLATFLDPSPVDTSPVDTSPVDTSAAPPGGVRDRSWTRLEGIAEALWFGSGSSEMIAPYQPMREQARRDIFAMLQEWWQAETALAETSGSWPDVLAVEYPFEIEVGGHRIRGSIDRVDRVPGGIAIVDYKTGSRVPRSDEVAADLQLAMYHLAAVRDPWLAAAGPPQSLRLCFLRSGAQPAQAITEDHEASTEQRIVKAAERILHEDFEPSADADCEYCDFWRLCPLQIQGREVGWD